MRRFFRAASALLLVTSLVACGDDDDNQSGSDTEEEDPTTTGDSESPQGSAAEGEPVRIGYVNLESATIDQSDIRLGAEAAVRYANAELGGIAGRPLELVVCKTAGTPESTTACANEMTAEGVPAVISGAEANRGLLASRLNEAGIPYIAISGTDEEEHQGSPSFLFGSGVVGIYMALAQYAADQGWSDFVMYTVDVPSALTTIESVAVPAFEDAGVNLNVVRMPADLADATPFVSDALRNNPQGYFVIGSTPQCIAVITAMNAAGSDAQQLGIVQCITPDVFEALGDDALNDTLLLQPFYAGEDTEEGALYVEKFPEYGDGANPDSGLVQQGWATALTFVRAANAGGLPADDITPETVSNAMNSAEDVPLALGAGETINCDGNALEGFPNICSAASFLVGIDGPVGRELIEIID